MNNAKIMEWAVGHVGRSAASAMAMLVALFGSARHASAVPRTVAPATEARERSRPARALPRHMWPGVERVASFPRPFGTVDGITSGKRYSLRHPRTNAKDTATVLGHGKLRSAGIHIVRVVFSDGHVARVAADRLHLLGQSFGLKRRYLLAQKRDAVEAIAKEFGVDGAKVPLVTMNPAILRKTWGGKMLIAGLERGGKAYVSRPFSSFNRRTMVHEILHALSRPFQQQMRRHKHTRLMEGITEHLALKAAVHLGHTGLTNKAAPYHCYARVAKQIASLVGEPLLRQVFFSKEPGAIRTLAESVDRRLGRQGAFGRAARALEARDVRPDLLADAPLRELGLDGQQR